MGRYQCSGFELRPVFRQHFKENIRLLVCGDSNQADYPCVSPTQQKNKFAEVFVQRDDDPPL